MTDKEKAIVMAYTGVCMLTGDKFQIFYKYVEDIMGRPVMTHELAFLRDEIKDKSTDDFISLCAEQESKVGHRIRFKDFPDSYYHIKCSECGQYWNFDGHAKMFKHCFNCGAKMIEPEEREKKPTCGNCKKWGTVNCTELYREPMENDDACVCIFFNSKSEE